MAQAPETAHDPALLAHISNYYNRRLTLGHRCARSQPPRLMPPENGRSPCGGGRPAFSWSRGALIRWTPGIPLRSNILRECWAMSRFEHPGVPFSDARSSRQRPRLRARRRPAVHHRLPARIDGFFSVSIQGALALVFPSVAALRCPHTNAVLRSPLGAGGRPPCAAHVEAQPSAPSAEADAAELAGVVESQRCSTPSSRASCAASAIWLDLRAAPGRSREPRRMR